MDESDLPLDHKPSKVVTLKGTRKVHYHTSGNKAQITVLAYANVAGNVISLFLKVNGSILNGQRVKCLTLFMECLTRGGQI